MATASENLIDGFYRAFDERDGDRMAAFYAPAARFSDPVFPGLTGDEPGAMWRMLTGQAKDLSVELLDREADGEHGSAHWRARYTFTQTGRPVTNDVRARFRFAGGLIAEHTDEFDFHLGAAGAWRSRTGSGLDSAAAIRHPPEGPRRARRLHVTRLNRGGRACSCPGVPASWTDAFTRRTNAGEASRPLL